jgi:hypothetical protein
LGDFTLIVSISVCVVALSVYLSTDHHRNGTKTR